LNGVHSNSAGHFFCTADERGKISHQTQSARVGGKGRGIKGWNPSALSFGDKGDEQAGSSEQMKSCEGRGKRNQKTREVARTGNEQKVKGGTV